MNILESHKFYMALWRLSIALCLIVLSLVPQFNRADAANSPGYPNSPYSQTFPYTLILVDDFKPQPYQGDAIYYYNRLNGDRGALNNSSMEWGSGFAKATVATGSTWGGFWESLNHPIREGRTVNFSAILPDAISFEYQSRITEINILITDGTPGRTFRLELKDNSNNLKGYREISLNGGPQKLEYAIQSQEYASLESVNQLVLVLDHAAPGDFVTVERISFIVTVPTKLINDPATSAFVWSYGMLLNNWNPVTGLVRDKSKDASGEFDAIQATGSLAAATALAHQLGIVNRVDAEAVVSKIGNTLLNNVPRYHGLWPHWVKVSNGLIIIKEDTEWSSVDTVIAAIGLLDAQYALGLDTSATGQMLKDIDWSDLTDLDHNPSTPPSAISHGYDYAGNLIPYTWDTFGGESWLAEIAYASATGQVAPLPYASPPTANGSGFIDELAWLFIQPPSALDIWGTNWNEYRNSATDAQISYYPGNYTNSCFSQIGLFGLSAAEVPDPSLVPKSAIYQPFGVGGRFGPPNDGSMLMGAPVIVPHYAAMVASLRPQESGQVWTWLMNNGYFSPLNNIESLMYDPASSNCEYEAVFNELRGSWNLSLQTLGWGIYLARQAGEIPAPWQATTQNMFLRNGFLLLVPGPSVLSINRSVPNPTNASSVNFTVAFSESVTGVDTSDFTLTTTGVTGASITSVNGSGKTYTVTANTGGGNGTIRLDVIDDNTIINQASNPLGGNALGDGNFNLGETYTVTKVTTFGDVPDSYWAWSYIERLYNAGITSGCNTSPLQYCPDATVTRAQMAVFLLKGIHSLVYPLPLVGDSTGFNDVPTDHWAAAWIKQLASEGITSGCGNGNYCPDDPVTRAQMAVFLLKSKHGSKYSPPNATGVFADVPVGYWADKWIEQLAAEGITGGCGGGNYCPDTPVTRAQMAVFLVKTFNLP